MATPTLRTCAKGHAYLKSTSCPSCPICEKAKKTKMGFLTALSAPALRALEKMGIKTLKQLSKYSGEELLAQHGVGPASLPVIRKALSEAGLQLKEP